MKTVADIIELLGGITATARRLDPSVPITTVSAWKMRDNIPVTYWPGLIEISDGQLTPEILMQAHMHKPEDAVGLEILPIPPDRPRLFPKAGAELGSGRED